MLEGETWEEESSSQASLGHFKCLRDKTRPPQKTGLSTDLKGLLAVYRQKLLYHIYHMTLNGEPRSIFCIFMGKVLQKRFGSNSA